MYKHRPIIQNYPHIIHDADYNPEQWKDTPEIWQRDLELLSEANMNSVTVGIFSWAELEPEEGRFDFSVLDEVMDRLAAQNAVAVLATPSGARPHWLAQQ